MQLTFPGAQEMSSSVLKSIWAVTQHSKSEFLMCITESLTRIKITVVETHQIANIQWIIENSREFQKKSASASLTTLNLCVYHNKL